MPCSRLLACMTCISFILRVTARLLLAVCSSRVCIKPKFCIELQDQGYEKNLQNYNYVQGPKAASLRSSVSTQESLLDAIMMWDKYTHLPQLMHILSGQVSCWKQGILNSSQVSWQRSQNLGPTS